MIYHVSSGLIRYHPSDPSRGKAPSPREGAHCPLPGWHAPGTRISAWSTGWYQSISCFCWCMLMPWSHCPKKMEMSPGWVGTVSLWIKKGNYGLNCIILYKDLCVERVRSSQHENGLWTASIHWTILDLRKSSPENGTSKRGLTNHTICWQDIVLFDEFDPTESADLTIHQPRP